MIITAAQRAEHVELCKKQPRVFRLFSLSLPPSLPQILGGIRESEVGRAINTGAANTLILKSEMEFVQQFNNLDNVD